MARLIFITGVEGSGTTMLLRNLSTPANCAAIGGNHFDLPKRPRAEPLAAAFGEATTRLWDQTREPGRDDALLREARRAYSKMVQSPAFAGIDRLVFKRSCPFNRPIGRYIPDPRDIAAIAPDRRVIVICRDPKAAVHSAVSRFGGTIEETARSVASNLDRLEATTPDIEHLALVSYREIGESPASAWRTIGDFAGIDFATHGAAEPFDHSVAQRYRAEMEPSDLEWIDSFFSQNPRDRWPRLGALM